MMFPRALYATSAALVLLALWLRVAGTPLPNAAAQGRVAMAIPTATPPQDVGTQESYEEIVTANVFSQERTAPRVRFSPQGASSLGANVSGKAVGRWGIRLYGITVGTQGASALIDADPKIPGAEIYRIGDLVAGARLAAITDSTVVLAEPSGPRILRLPPREGKKP